ncbi:MAG: ectonucleotide pyrophosphatase/phosphodiesterase [Gemmatimonadaceae bacterium]
MRARFTLLIALVVAACTPSVARTPAIAVTGPTGRPPLIVVGVDGFRRSYYETDSLPVLHAIGRTGVVSDWMIPSFPTLTFPNFNALATGLYPEYSGIVNNRFYDPELHALFALGSASVREARWWWGEPIWVTAAKHGDRTGVYFWVGSKAPIDGDRPTFWKPYDGTVPFDARVDQVLAWLDLPAARRSALLIQARDGNNAAPLTRLRRLPHVRVWLKADVPPRLHYNEGPRIPAIVGVADDGWTIAWRHGRPLRMRGEHGFDNADTSMRALFVAHGPAFRAGTTLAAFPNVDVYDLLAHLLNVPPAPNDGTLAPFVQILRGP